MSRSLLVADDAPCSQESTDAGGASNAPTPAPPASARHLQYASAAAAAKQCALARCRIANIAAAKRYLLRAKAAAVARFQGAEAAEAAEAEHQASRGLLQVWGHGKLRLRR